MLLGVVPGDGTRGCVETEVEVVPPVAVYYLPPNAYNPLEHVEDLLPFFSLPFCTGPLPTIQNNTWQL